MAQPIRVLIAKPGLDGHDRGALVVAKGLRDEGMEVIYTGLRQTPAQIVATAIEEDVACVGLSSLSGAHMSLFPEVVKGLRDAGADDILVIGGGVIPAADVQALKRMGVAEIFTPGSTMREMAEFIRAHVQGRELDLAPTPVEQLDHIGIAVNDLEASVEFYERTFGLKLERIETVEDQSVRVAFLSAGSTHLELLCPTDDGAAVAKFLAKRGPGLHHIAFSVEDIERSLAGAAAQGMVLIDEQPRLGAGGKKIAFLHPKSTGGVLTEYCQTVMEGEAHA
ncbi:methylmalonyl-CoA epimerase [Alicyclobacillus fastidiosus]|uniref:Methylmalonyl-CoA epimerase n=1 Tax=Alicyclobacillus fastidiosus TaxID=392011 RepID=A0ABV5AG19_9BACL|nr:methylmalonyl-CoA epimerase [Alicyclobacillus fastidiosus]WEH11751.1 methylmalonyl-CoA epimerase [Alicyclobacillus fastidiosus]